MDLIGIILNYSTNNGGMRQPITLFLNDVMREKAGQLAEVVGQVRSSTRIAHRNDYRQ